MAAFEMILFGVTDVIVALGVVVVIITLMAFKNGQVEELRQRHWKAVLEQAKREVGEE